MRVKVLVAQIVAAVVSGFVGRAVRSQLTSTIIDSALSARPPRARRK